MKQKPLIETNPYLRDPNKFRKALITSVASSTAIANLSHSAAAEDMDKLKKVMGDAAAPAEVRELAGIILNISHKPSAADKGKLEKMMK